MERTSPSATMTLEEVDALVDLALNKRPGTSWTR